MGFSEDVLEPGLIRVFEVFRDAESQRVPFEECPHGRMARGLARTRHRRAADHALRNRERGRNLSVSSRALQPFPQAQATAFQPHLFQHAPLRSHRPSGKAFRILGIEIGVAQQGLVASNRLPRSPRSARAADHSRAGPCSSASRLGAPAAQPEHPIWAPPSSQRLMAGGAWPPVGIATSDDIDMTRAVEAERHRHRAIEEITVMADNKHRYRRSRR